MGTAELSCASLRALVDAPGFEVIAVVTQPDRPKGRELHVQASPVKELALRLAVPVLQPERAREERFLSEMQRLKPDLIAVAAFGQLLPRALLELPRFGCINVHTSLLPKYRGAAPIQWAILNNESETGVTIMKMDAGMDTGDILSQEKTPIEPSDTSETLHERLARMGAQLLVGTTGEYVAGRIRPQPQVADLATYAPKIKKEDGQIRWTDPARKIWNQVRGLVPWPGAFTHLPVQGGRPQFLKLWQAEVVGLTGNPGEVLHADKTGLIIGCGQDALRVLQLQREGGRRLSAEQFLAGHRLSSGQRVG